MSALSPSELEASALTQQLKEGESERQKEDETTERAEEEEEDDDLLGQSTEDEVGQMLRSTLTDLETALEESRKLLGERDRELAQLKAEVEGYKLQVAREIANKTKIAKSLDDSLTLVREMEEMTQQWQLEVRESRQVNSQLQTQLERERGKNHDLRSQLSELNQEKEDTITRLTSQLLETKKETRKGKKISSDSEGLDDMTFRFLRQAVYHFLADVYSEDHLRSICSILNFTPQERKVVYSKFGERKK